MVDYTIFMLDEDEMTIDGAVLDGVDQGDGHHMIGAKITLSPNNWTGIDITDDDSAFGDSDNSQVLDGPATINGTTYSSGTRVEAEYSLIVEDPDGVQYTLVAFNVNNSNPSYGTVEGLAFIGPQGGFPPANVELTVLSNAEGPSFDSDTYATPICFAKGTLIDTLDGPRPVHTLCPGDMIVTRHNGPQPLRWIGMRSFAAQGRFAPIVFRPGAIGNRNELRVSRQHRIEVANWQTELLFGAPEVLVAAKDFVDGDNVITEEGGTITYVHLLFDSHQIVFAEGVAAESLHPGDCAMRSLTSKSRSEVLEIFPELEDNLSVYGPAHSPGLKRYEARALLNL